MWKTDKLILVITDIFTLIFTSESVVSRVQQEQSPNSNTSIATDIALIHVSESMLDIIKLSTKSLNYIFAGSTPKNILESVKKLKDILTLNTDTITKKRSLGNFMLDQQDYPF